MPAMDIKSSFQERKGWLFEPEKSGSVSKALFDLKPEVEAGPADAVDGGWSRRLPGVPPVPRCAAGFQAFLPLCGLASILSAFLAALAAAWCCCI